MGERVSSWFAGIGSTAKAIAVVVALITLIITATLAMAQQVGLPERVTATEHAVDSLRFRADANARGIQQIREDTQAILCIITLAPSISPAEARLRCP